MMGPWLHVFPDRVEREPFDWVGQMCRWWDRFLSRRQLPAPWRLRPRAKPAAGPTALIYVNGNGALACLRRLAATDERASSFSPSPNGLGVCPRGDVEYRLCFHFARSPVRRQGCSTPSVPGSASPRTSTTTTWPRSLSRPSSCRLTSSSPASRCQPHYPAGSFRDLRLVVKLCDVSPEGSSTLLTSGWTRSWQHLLTENGVRGTSIVCR